MAVTFANCVDTSILRWICLLTTPASASAPSAPLPIAHAAIKASKIGHAIAAPRKLHCGPAEYRLSVAHRRVLTILLAAGINFLCTQRCAVTGKKQNKGP